MLTLDPAPVGDIVATVYKDGSALYVESRLRNNHPLRASGLPGAHPPFATALTE